jgi:hypothetical protein
MANYKAGTTGYMQFRSFMARVEFDIKQKELKKKGKSYWKCIENNGTFAAPRYKRIVPTKKSTVKKRVNTK